MCTLGYDVFKWEKENPKSILIENTYRWNHDLKHEKYKKVGNNNPYDNIECKSIFKPKFFKDIKTHLPLKHINKKNKIKNLLI